MYANLKVTIAEHGTPRHHGEEMLAHDVTIVGTTVRISLDKQDGTGNYAEPAGVREVDLMSHHVGIEASF